MGIPLFRRVPYPSAPFPFLVWVCELGTAFTSSEAVYIFVPEKKGVGRCSNSTKLKKGDWNVWHNPRRWYTHSPLLLPAGCINL